MRNNSFLSTIGLLSITLIPIEKCIASKIEKVAKKGNPNIVFILADDLGYNDLGCYGAKWIKTPNIDELAARGIRFSQHYAGAAVSAPSRCSLLTGLHTGHSPIRGNKQWQPYGQIPLPENTVTVTDILKKQGYSTSLVGKWALGIENSPGDPLKHGFDFYFGYLCQVLAHNHYPLYLMENGKKILLHNKVVWRGNNSSYPVEKNEYSQDLFTAKALHFFEENQNNPFFLYFSVILPHQNTDALQGKRYSEIPSFAPYENENWTEEEKGYAAMITRLDTEVGKLIHKLKELNLYENTIIIFSSDNGATSPGKFASESNLPFRGGKRDLYEGAIRVPFIVSWPQKIKEGKVSTYQSAFWDFLPTVCDITNYKEEINTDGISFLPELLGSTQKKHPFLYYEHHDQGGKQAIIKDNWKCIRLFVNNPHKTHSELYDLENDPGETTNLASKYPDKVNELLNLMKENRIENPFFPFPPEPLYVPFYYIAPEWFQFLKLSRKMFPTWTQTGKKSNL